MWWRLARRLQLSPWESSVVNRLLTPTHSFLARSKSTAALSGDTGKTVKVPLSWWGKVFLLKHTWAPRSIRSHLGLPQCVRLLSAWVQQLWKCLLVLVSCSWYHFPFASYLDTRCQADKGCPSLGSNGFGCFCVFVVSPQKPTPSPLFSLPLHLSKPSEVDTI